MGIPQHYSRDIAMRCNSLIRHLLPKIDAGLPDDHQFGGPLRTTFLLAMATPMIVLPVERIFPKGAGRNRTGDDRRIDPKLTALVDDALGPKKTFGDSPFGGRHWHYLPKVPVFDVAAPWPYDLLKALGDPGAGKNALVATTASILLDLRHAISHGGVAYLDKDGRQSDGEAAMPAFAAWKIDDRKLVGLNILRVSEKAFCDFLAAWAKWLSASGVERQLN